MYPNDRQIISAAFWSILSSQTVPQTSLWNTSTIPLDCVGPPTKRNAGGTRNISKTWPPFQYPIRRLIVRSRKVSKSRGLYLESSNRSEIWQAPRQRCCRCPCQISKQCDDWNYQSRGFDTSWDLKIRCLIGDWNGAQRPITLRISHYNPNVMEISFCSHPTSNGVIATQFCTWHDSCAVVACARC